MKQILTIPYLHSLLRERPADGHKGTFGHALLVAGKWGMAGASILAAEACLRSGVGKLTLHIPTRNNDIVQTRLPEAIVQHDTNDTHFTHAVELTVYDALGIGPGLGTMEDTAEALHEQLILAANTPCVIDADALNILAEHPSWWQDIPNNAILTPHGGEEQRLKQAGYDFRNVITIHKGHPTIITTADETWECPWGNDGMATAGSGDVLTGLITGLLAQGYTPKEAAILGVALHALAGDHAAQQTSTHTLIASDIIKNLHHAFNTIKS